MGELLAVAVPVGCLTMAEVVLFAAKVKKLNLLITSLNRPERNLQLYISKIRKNNKDPRGKLIFLDQSSTVASLHCRLAKSAMV